MLNILKMMQRTNVNLLGRWKLKHNSKSECITVNFANMDHCGDSICGTPSEYSKHTDDALKKNKK